MAKKIDKKQLDEPDKLQRFFLSAREFTQRHRTRIYLGTGVFFLLLVLVGGWHLYRLNYEKNAAKVYAKIFETAQKAGSPAGDQAAIKEYKELISDYPRSPAAVIARYRLGNLYFNGRAIDEAILAYQAFLKESPADSDLVTLAHHALGACHEAKKNFKEALQSYEIAMNTKTASSFEALNYLSIARVHEAMSSPEKAVEFYRKALGKTTDPLTTLYIKRRIAILG